MAGTSDVYVRTETCIAKARTYFILISFLFTLVAGGYIYTFYATGQNFGALTDRVQVQEGRVDQINDESYSAKERLVRIEERVDYLISRVESIEAMLEKRQPTNDK